MSKNIHVHSLYSPGQDSIISHILSSEYTEIIDKKIVPLPKAGMIMVYIEYEDTSNYGDFEESIIKMIGKTPAYSEDEED